MRRLLQLLLAFLLSYVAVDLLWVSKPAPAINKSAIVRLAFPDGRFFCSGVLINRHQVITAGHCIEALLPQYFLGVQISNGYEGLEIRDVDNILIGRFLLSVKYQPRTDLGMVLLDLPNHATLPAEIEPRRIEEARGHNLVSCGYPYGGNLFCSSVRHVEWWNFGFRAIAILFPGMSGGPVVDLDTGKVIAVNSAVYEDHVMLVPLVNIYNQLDINDQK